MYKIVRKRVLKPNIYLMDVLAKRCSRSALPGQFIIIRIDDKGERIPLTICDTNKDEGTVSIVFQSVGDSTKQMASMNEGDSFMDFAGPLGNPSDLVYKDVESLKNMKIVFIAGGVGTAPVYPQVKFLHEKGVDCDVIIGTKSIDTLIFEDEMRKVATNLYISTDDGSYGFHGNATECLKDLVNNKGKKYDHAVVIGPMIMMKFTTMATKEMGISTTVSLNSIMVDGTGMCGACRVNIGGKMKFTCVDGPEFDGFLVDFDQAMKRQSMYKTYEGRKQLKEMDKGTHGGNPYCTCDDK